MPREILIFSMMAAVGALNVDDAVRTAHLKIRESVAGWKSGLSGRRAIVIESRSAGGMDEAILISGLQLTHYQLLSVILNPDMVRQRGSALVSAQGEIADLTPTDLLERTTMTRPADRNCPNSAKEAFIVTFEHRGVVQSRTEFGLCTDGERKFDPMMDWRIVASRIENQVDPE